MTDTDIKTEQKEAKLTAVEDGLAEFILDGGFDESQQAKDEDVFFWPTSKLPENIKIGDKVCISMELKNKEERIREVKKEKEQELKYAEMRKILEDLIN
ncbi:hypothetical protein C0416_02590 [bacterium]|nr:hypothetical protein [bacterium]